MCEAIFCVFACLAVFMCVYLYVVCVCVRVYLCVCVLCPCFVFVFRIRLFVLALPHALFMAFTLVYLFISLYCVSTH